MPSQPPHQATDVASPSITMLPLVFQGDTAPLYTAMQAAVDAGQGDAVLPVLRTAILQPGHTTMWYQRALNLWNTLGRPGLKPNVVHKRVVLLADHTVDHLVPLLTIHAAAVGLHLDIQVGTYDAVELEALHPESEVYATDADFILVLLSDHWLRRHFGPHALVPVAAVEGALDMVHQVTQALVAHSSATVVLANFPPPTTAYPASQTVTQDGMGWTAAVTRINNALFTGQTDRLVVVDTADALYAAGGRQAISLTNYLRAKIPYTAAGSIAVAREVAFSLAALCGKAHRALVTDFDNTLWGGEVGDCGFHGILCNQEDPNALGYYLLQRFLQGLPSIGVLLAGASKNSPEMEAVFDENGDLALRREDFASLQISWDPKSQAIHRISGELNFGPEFMLFVDDSLFELAEALQQHPTLDVMLAGPEPTQTLERLTASRCFHQTVITDADRARQERMRAQRQSAAFQQTFTDLTSYLEAIQIQVQAYEVNGDNRTRVLQLLQRSNQFNLTTRRHGDGDLAALEAQGAIIRCFAYEDKFGPQGIIGVVILVPDGDGIDIESWVMSCRVLNRTVEAAVLNWMCDQAAGRPLRGHYHPTEKNGIVRDLYERLHFRPLPAEGDGATHWELSTDGTQTLPWHAVHLEDHGKDATP